jgi:glyoxylase-like metal-dependent hydrolase (beta-lactamase superfamily II)
MTAVRELDTLHRGRRRAICCFQVGEVLVDPGPTSSIQNVLDALDGISPRAVLLTHIHFDHAASTGMLARMYPDLEVYVHELGAPHMADPERLWSSASRLYGEENMLALWGEFLPVPPERMHALAGGETLQFGELRFEVAYTPGHAKHHVSFLHEGTAFVGDVGGVRIEPGSPTLPPTPPPDIDVEAWHASIERILRWKPDTLAITHFGGCDDPEGQLAELAQRLDHWAQAARTQDRDGWVAEMEGELRAATTPETFDTFLHAIPVDQSYAGLRRYWDKKLAE